MRGSVLVALVGLVGACKHSEGGNASPPAAAPAATTVATPSPAKAALSPYHGTLRNADGVVDAVLDLPSASGEGAVVCGTERIPVDVAWQGQHLVITARWPYVSRITATRDAQGHLAGSWVRETPLFAHVELPFEASPGAAAPAARSAIDPSGRWRLDLETFGESVAELARSSDGTLTGWIRPGELSSFTLVGHSEGTHLALSSFDMHTAYFLSADLTPDGKQMHGRAGALGVWTEGLTATRAAADWWPKKRVVLAHGSTVTVPGVKPGKPTLVLYMATWCPGCHAFTSYFQPLYDAYHRRGLDVFALVADLTESGSDARAALDTFRASHAVPWPTRILPGSEEDWAKLLPPEIKGWDGYPVIILLDATGHVRFVSGGWPNATHVSAAAVAHRELESALAKLLP